MLKKLALAAVAAALGSGVAFAATVTGTFSVQATITPICSIDSLPSYNFGTIGGTAVTIQNTTPTSVQINCSNGLPYAVTLASANNAAFGSSYAFNMTNGSKALGYRLYANAFGTQWDATAGGTYNAVGNGLAQTISMYGDIPLQTPPAGGWTIGTYNDTVTMTVTY